MTLNYESQLPSLRRRRYSPRNLVADGFIAYFLASIVSLPLLNAWWIGELPVFALVQLPKTLIAGWIRTGVIMPLIRLLGFSRGSFSPDYTLAGPYALAIAYLLPIIVVLAWRWICKDGASRRRVWILLAVESIDLILFLIFDHSRGLTIY